MQLRSTKNIQTKHFSKNEGQEYKNLPQHNNTMTGKEMVKSFKSTLYRSTPENVTTHHTYIKKKSKKNKSKKQKQLHGQ